MNVESITREGHSSFSVFTARAHIRRTPLLIAASVLSLLIIGIAITARPKPQQSKSKQLTTADCDAMGFTAKYFFHIVGNMANHQPKRCITGTVDRHHCKCASPAAATPNQWDPEWNTVFQRNLGLMNNLMQADSNNSTSHLDVLLIGDSQVEHWLGTNNTHFRSKDTGHKEWSDQLALYQQYFRPNTSSTAMHSVEDKAVHGLALGIAQDGYSHVLYRIQNGELPVNLKVPVIWINVGINDLLYHTCNAEGVVAGIVATVQAIQKIRSQNDQPTRIVMNSLVSVPLLKEEIIKVNERLYCYAEQTPHVDFFNLSSVLLAGEMVDYNAQLNAAGYNVWGQAIVRHVLRIFEEEGL